MKDGLDMDKLLSKVAKGKVRKTADVLREASRKYCNLKPIKE